MVQTIDGCTPAKAAHEGLATYCFSAGGIASEVGAGGSGVAPRSSGASAQSPAQILVPLTDPNCLQAIGADGLTCFTNLGRRGLSEGRRRKADDRGKDQQSPHRHFPIALRPFNLTPRCRAILKTLSAGRFNSSAISSRVFAAAAISISRCCSENDHEPRLNSPVILCSSPSAR
jgi:hypothetical protein